MATLDRPLVVPTRFTDLNHMGRVLGNAINQLMNGKNNALGSVTLTASTTTTVVADPRVGTNSVITFIGTTSNGGIALADATNPLFISSRGDGTFTITHHSDAAVDQTLEYSITG